MTDNIIHLAGRILPPCHSVARSRGKKDRAPFYRASSRLADNRSGLSLEELRLRGLAAETMTPRSFSTRAAFKFAQAADAVFNVFSGLFIAVFGILYFLSPFIALGCMFFL